MASCTMYKMKPFYSDEKVAYEQRSSMYKMKNIHEDSIEDLVCFYNDTMKEFLFKEFQFRFVETSDQFYQNAVVRETFFCACRIL